MGNWERLETPGTAKSRSGLAEPTFAQLLDWHLSRGTRPSGTPELPKEQWYNQTFGHALGVSDKTVRNWRFGRNVPDEIASIERELFGKSEAYNAWREELREAHRVAQRRQLAHQKIKGAKKLPAAPKPLAVFKDVGAAWCPELVMIPVGEFLMGSPEGEDGRFDDERPQHVVTIGHRFALGRYPVTFDEYDLFCTATKRRFPKDEGWGRGHMPVINVCWEDAQAYMVWLSRETGLPYRLPTEAEWEYACRAGSTTPYSFGDRIAVPNANYSSSKIAQTTEVGKYPPSDWGLHDMHGNVWEWCLDGKREYGTQRVVDPIGPTDVSVYRVTRGGSWSAGVRYLRSAFRHADPPSYRANDMGFRCARSMD